MVVARMRPKVVLRSGALRLLLLAGAAAVLVLLAGATRAHAATGSPGPVIPPLAALGSRPRRSRRQPPRPLRAPTGAPDRAGSVGRAAPRPATSHDRPSPRVARSAGARPARRLRAHPRSAGSAARAPVFPASSGSCSPFCPPRRSPIRCSALPHSHPPGSGSRPLRSRPPGPGAPGLQCPRFGSTRSAPPPARPAWRRCRVHAHPAHPGPTGPQPASLVVDPRRVRGGGRPGAARPRE